MLVRLLKLAGKLDFPIRWPLRGPFEHWQPGGDWRLRMAATG